MQHGQQNVCRVDVSVVFGQGQALGIAQGFLKLRGQFVHSHVKLLLPFILGRSVYFSRASSFSALQAISGPKIAS
jgi:hypothetical protein